MTIGELRELIKDLPDDTPMYWLDVAGEPHCPVVYVDFDQDDEGELPGKALYVGD